MLPDPGRARQTITPHQDRELPHLARRARRASCSTGAGGPWTGSATEGVDQQFADQRAWLDDYWARCDVEVEGQPEIQQAVRWNLFQLAQAAARAEGSRHPGQGRHRLGLRRSLLLGHRDLRAPVPHLHRRVGPQRAAVPLLQLPAARRRASELAQRGALFPWRTINGEEASAYYAAGTAQYHINADIAYALSKYVEATGDEDFLTREGIDIFVETARMWADLGFWRSNGREDSFHIHGVTGPDEYTTVVNDNLFTNVMARFNLRRGGARRWSELEATGRSSTRDGRAAGARRRRGRRVGAGGRGDVHPVRREPRHPPAGPALPRAGGVGPAETPRGRSGRCCCTTTRW